MPDVVRPCVLSKDSDGMPCPMSLDRVCCLQAMIACHARRCSTVCVVQRQRCHATPDVAYRVQSKGGNVMPSPTLTIVCSVQGR